MINFKVITDQIKATKTTLTSEQALARLAEIKALKKANHAKTLAALKEMNRGAK